MTVLLTLLPDFCIAIFVLRYVTSRLRNVFYLSLNYEMIIKKLLILCPFPTIHWKQHFKRHQMIIYLQNNYEKFFVLHRLFETRENSSKQNRFSLFDLIHSSLRRQSYILKKQICLLMSALSAPPCLEIKRYRISRTTVTVS